ncbi:MAG: hypothetical protein M3Q30_23755 [Actinomycetota bacterium]|nr:hypothetical protein [Actinomycetota bacterium]
MSERRDPLRSVAVAVFVVLLSVAAGAVFVAAVSTRSWFPSRWDARVAPIAAEVARLRGLDFEHPVPVRYLPPKEFEKLLGDDSNLSATERERVTRDEAVFRALGFIGGKVDLLRAYETHQSSGTLAYYDPDHQEIIVRGTALDVAHRVTVAHELTHVLQDQHFDLRTLQKRAATSETGDASALKALVEGDAVRIQDDYLAQLSAAEQKEYQRENDAEGARVGKETASVPDIVDLLSGAPYEFGPSTVRVLLSAGGNAVLPADGVAAGPAESFGPFETFVTLAMRLDPGRALAAADVIAGGRAVTFRSRGSTCYRVVVQPAFAHSRPFLLRAIQDWARARPSTAVDAVGDRVGFTTCDPGRSAPEPSSQRFHDAVALLSVRAGLTVAAAKGHVAGALARCVARVFIETPRAEKLAFAIGNGTPSSEQGAQLRAIAAASGEACRADADSGLP